MRLRTIVSVAPGGYALEAALTSPADAVLLTCADANHPVEDLREQAAHAIARARDHGKPVLVTVNHPRTRLLRGDLEAVTLPGLAGVLLTHVVEPQDVRDTAVILREFELGRGLEPGQVAVFPIICTARGLVRATEIVHAAPRTGGLVFDGNGYARDVGARPEERGPRLSYARGAVVAAARAHDRLPLVVSSAFELRENAHYGFTGVILPDALAIPQANAAFAPTELERLRAEAALAAYEAARANGEWVARLGGDVVDASAARRARQVLE